MELETLTSVDPAQDLDQSRSILKIVMMRVVALTAVFIQGHILATVDVSLDDILSEIGALDSQMFGKCS